MGRGAQVSLLWVVLTSILHKFLVQLSFFSLSWRCCGWGGQSPACCASALPGTELSLLKVGGKREEVTALLPWGPLGRSGLVLALLGMGQALGGHCSKKPFFKKPKKLQPPGPSRTRLSRGASGLFHTRVCPWVGRVWRGKSALGAAPVIPGAVGAQGACAGCARGQGWGTAEV